MKCFVRNDMKSAITKPNLVMHFSVIYYRLSKISSMIGSYFGIIKYNICYTFQLLLIYVLVTPNTLHEHIQPLRISQQNSDLAQSLSRNNSPPASLTNLENSRRTSQAKWLCQVNCLDIMFYKRFLILIILKKLF